MRELQRLSCSSGKDATTVKLDNPLLNRFAGVTAAGLTRAWMGTLDTKIAYYDRATDPGSPECRGHKIYIFWHEYILFPLYLRGHSNLTMLLSQHQDAEILSHAARRMGFGVIRGSTRRGSVGAIRRLLDESRHMHLAITPDGPRGPRRHMASGPIFLASRLGIPLVLIGLGHDRPWRLNSWDRFAIPRPYSRARCVLSPDIHVPAGLGRNALDHFRRRVERARAGSCGRQVVLRAALGQRPPGYTGALSEQVLLLHAAEGPLRY